MRTVQKLFQSFSDTVLLVGNGMMRSHRKLIDSYDTVVRFNKFRIEGFEEHVGTKISAIGFAAANLELEHTKNLYPVYEQYVDFVPLFAFSKGSDEYTGNMHLLQPRTRLFGAGDLLFQDPDVGLSTGTSTALNLALFFDKEVHLIGFDFMQSGHYWKDSHIHSARHSGNFERHLISKIPAIHIL